MSTDVLRERLRSVEGKIREKYSAKTEWLDDNTVKVDGPGVKGKLQIGESTVDLNLDLGLMLSPLKGKIEEGLSKELDKMVQP